MHVQDTMPKGHRPSRSQGIYRQSPMVASSSSSSSHYTAHPLARTTSQLNSSYYAQSADLMQQAQLHQSSYSTPSYATGGPVQQPIQYSSHSTSSLPSLPITTTSPPTSLRASSGAWSPHDDSTLMAARASGMNWLPIQQAYFPTKTANACRKRHERLMERRNADDWDDGKLERLATAYLSMRKDLWQPLADAVGEKWNVVEAKCMSQGVKNLQTHARAQTRRERLMDGHGHPSMPQTSSHSHSTSLSSIHSQPSSSHALGPSSYTYAPHHSSTADDSAIGLDMNDLDGGDYDDHDHDGNGDGSDSERSRSASSLYGHQASSGGLSTSHNSNGGYSTGSRGSSGWNGQQMVSMNGSGSGRLPSMSESGIGIDSLIHRNGR